MMSIDSIGQVSRSTSMNSGRSSFRDWRNQSTENTTLNQEEQSPFTGGGVHNNESVESGSGQASMFPKHASKSSHKSRNHLTSTLISISDKHKISMKSVIDKRMTESGMAVQRNKEAESTITMTPSLVPCRLRLDSAASTAHDHDHEGDTEEVDSAMHTSTPMNHAASTSANLVKNPQPLRSLLNPLVGSQDPIDALLITKVDIHQAMSSNSRTSSNSLYACAPLS